MKLLKSSLPLLRSTSMPMIGDVAADGAVDPNRRARALLYQSHKWRKAAHAFLAAHPDCAWCGGKAVLVDHVLGHQGDWLSRFWNRKLWQSMCGPCHSRKTSTLEQAGAGGRRLGGQVTGAVAPAGGAGLQLGPPAANHALPHSVKEKIRDEKGGDGEI